MALGNAAIDVDAHRKEVAEGLKAVAIYRFRLTQ